MSEGIVSDVLPEVGGREWRRYKPTSLSLSYPYQKTTAGRIIKYRIADIDKDEGDGEGEPERSRPSRQMCGSYDCRCATPYPLLRNNGTYKLQYSIG